MEKSIKVKLIGYQRNGVCGEGFYMARILDADYPMANLLATFVMSSSGLKGDDWKCESRWKLNVETVRVIDTNDLSLAWRGDNYGWAMLQIFERELKRQNDEKGSTCMDGECNCEGKSILVGDLKGIILS